MQMQQPMMGSVYKAVPGGNQFQFFPTQIGGPTPYARSRRLLFIGVTVYELLMAIMSIIEFANFLSGFIMLIAAVFGFLAAKEDMNITYVCWFGVLSFAGFVAGLVGAFIGFAVKISTIIIKFNIPLSAFCGMAVSWWLYSDYEAEHPESTDMIASWLRAFGVLKPKAEATAGGMYSATLLSKGQLPQFGGGYDSFKTQAGQEKIAAAQEGGFAGSMFGGSKAASAAPPGAPRAELARDPFLTS